MQVVAISSNTPVSAVRAQPQENAEVALTEPLHSGFAGDPLSAFFAAMEQLAQASLASSKLRIEGVDARLQQKLEELLEKLDAACEAVRASRENQDDGGWLSDVTGFVGNVLGEVLGAVIDFGVDAVTGPIEVAIATVENFGDAEAMLRAIRDSTQKLLENGSTAEDVKGFTKGVVAFTSELFELSVRLQTALARSAVTGENVGELVADDLKRAWGSLRENILDNPHFWAVTGALAKGTAVVAAAMSGGALLPVAAGLLVLLEADKRYGVFEAAVGDKAASWVRLGVEVAAGLCLAGAATGSTNGLVNALRTATGITQGAGAVYAGYNMVVSADANADRIEQEADVMATMQQAQRLQRLMDSLIASLRGDAKDHQKTRELGAGLFRTQAAIEQAHIVSA